MLYERTFYLSSSRETRRSFSEHWELISRVVNTVNELLISVLWCAQVLLGERDEHQVLVDKLQEVARHISDQPDVQDQVTTIRERWDHMRVSSDERSHELQQVRNA